MRLSESKSPKRGGLKVMQGVEISMGLMAIALVVSVLVALVSFCLLGKALLVSEERRKEVSQLRSTLGRVKQERDIYATCLNAIEKSLSEIR